VVPADEAGVEVQAVDVAAPARPVVAAHHQLSNRQIRRRLRREWTA
jgi:hypothetical protein